MPNNRLVKVTFNIEEGDRETLREFYPKLNWSVAARAVLNQFCRKLRERANAEVRNVARDPNADAKSIAVSISDES